MYEQISGPQFPMLEKVGGRVFSISHDPEGFCISEECDQWFTVTLTREELIRLADELRAVAELPPPAT